MKTPIQPPVGPKTRTYRCTDNDTGETVWFTDLIERLFGGRATGQSTTIRGRSRARIERGPDAAAWKRRCRCS